MGYTHHRFQYMGNRPHGTANTWCRKHKIREHDNGNTNTKSKEPAGYNQRKIGFRQIGLRIQGKTLLISKVTLLNT
jgi:hypothetical protein